MANAFSLKVAVILSGVPGTGLDSAFVGDHSCFDCPCGDNHGGDLLQKKTSFSDYRMVLVSGQPGALCVFLRRSAKAGYRPLCLSADGWYGYNCRLGRGGVVDQIEVSQMAYRNTRPGAVGCLYGHVVDKGRPLVG